jgi:hypothetical protein
MLSSVITSSIGVVSRSFKVDYSGSVVVVDDVSISLHGPGNPELPKGGPASALPLPDASIPSPK